MNERRQSNYYHLMEARIKYSEELIDIAMKKLDMKVPKVWQIKLMQKYFKNLKEAKTKLDHIEWLLYDVKMLSDKETVAKVK